MVPPKHLKTHFKHLIEIVEVASIKEGVYFNFFKNYLLCYFERKVLWWQLISTSSLHSQISGNLRFASIAVDSCSKTSSAIF